MLTYTQRRNLAGKMVGDSSSANLTLLDTLINEADREVITMKPWPFREKSKTISTVASQQFYNLPSDCFTVNDVTVTVGSTKWTPRIITVREEWDRINQSTAITSNIPQYAFIYAGQLGFYPTPSSATASAVTYNYMRGHRDLSIADYTTGTITSITSAATTVTGNSTSWTSQMAGRFIQITDGNAANSGDGNWYEISSVTSTTILELVSPYQGTSISAATTAYTIGQVSILEDFQIVSIDRACQRYFTGIQPEKDRRDSYEKAYLTGLKRMQIELGGKTL